MVAFIETDVTCCSIRQITSWFGKLEVKPSMLSLSCYRCAARCLISSEQNTLGFLAAAFDASVADNKP